MKKIRGKLFLALVLVSLIACGMRAYKLLDLFNYDAEFQNVDLMQTEIYSDANVKNIMLFGVDAENGGTSRSDAMMVLSVDYDNNKLKLISLMRDSYVVIEGHDHDKLTHAYSYGGPELTIKTVNDNFGLDISEYATVNFEQMASIIDAVGGVLIDVNEAEMKEANKYIGEYGRTYGVDVTQIEQPGIQILDGVQAMTYGRIRKNGTGDDWGRVERQSEVLNGIFLNVKEASPIKLYKMMEELLPNVTTSLSKNEMLTMGAKLLIGGKPEMEHIRIPMDGSWKGKKIGGVYYTVFDTYEASEQIYEYVYLDGQKESEE